MKIENCKLKISNKAFSLIEIMVAIAIVGILSAVVLVSMQSYGVKARAAKALAQASSVIPSMVSCAGNGGTPIFGASGTNICSVITGAANYGSWPTFPGDYAVASGTPTPNWTSSSNWVFKVSSTADSQNFCCNSKMNSCGMPSTCDVNATW
jgi:prepilin-type N-terminal cleavage/methylation domain-containing protein